MHDPPSHFKVIACGSDGRATRLHPLDGFGPLYDNLTVKEALAEPTESMVFSEMLLRGWLDG
jgi:hypothetical protein